MDTFKLKPWLSRWNLIPDGIPFITHTSQLYPVKTAAHGIKAMLKSSKQLWCLRYQHQTEKKSNTEGILCPICYLSFQWSRIMRKPLNSTGKICNFLTLDTFPPFFAIMLQRVELYQSSPLIYGTEEGCEM
ncbi:hypothetical protein [Klebsiella variicola]|uniref:hypothetical protein n=1 Tax=Klebsiella variicola TaxID=244366 RepID=UPI003F53BCC5